MTATPPPPTGAPPPPPPGAPSGGGASSGARTAWIVGGIAAGVAVIAAIVVVILVLAGDDGSDDEEEEVFLEPISDVGVDPFTESIGDGTEVEETLDAPASSDGTTTINADTVGLYGGTLHESSCDREQLVVFLRQNPDKAAAWAGVHGIDPGEIPTYVDDLTPVILRGDTRVTNHGFVDGTANPIQSVLQAGSAVLVDKYGAPVVRCACGNPLLAPKAVVKPVYTRPAWPRWSPDRVVVIQQTTVIIDEWVLVDPVTGDTFTRPRGTDGGDDQPTTPEPEEPDTTTTSPPVTQPPATQPPATEPSSTGDDAIAIFQNARNNQCAGVTFPFEPHISESISASPAAGPGLWTVTVVGQVESGEQVFRWTVDVANGTLTPANQLAAEAAAACPALGS